MTKKISNNQSLLRGFIEREFNRSDYTRVSDYFEFFAADKTLKEDELSADDINLGLMGRSGDGGCDGAYLFCNSELVHEDEIKSVADRSREAQLRVVIIQAKNELSGMRTESWTLGRPDWSPHVFDGGSAQGR